MHSGERYYAELRRRHLDPARQVGWRHRIEQAYRFEAAMECVAPTEGVVLDVGCGLGGFARYLRDSEDRRGWIGIEPDPTFAAHSAQYGEVLNEGFESVDLARLNADSAVAIGTLTHARNPPEDLRALLTMLERVTSTFCVTVLDRQALDARPALALEHSASALSEDAVKAAAARCGYQTSVSHLFPTDLILFAWRDVGPSVRSNAARFAATIAGPWGVQEPPERHAWLAVEIGLFAEALRILEEAPPSDLTALLFERIQLARSPWRGR